MCRACVFVRVVFVCVIVYVLCAYVRGFFVVVVGVLDFVCAVCLCDFVAWCAFIFVCVMIVCVLCVVCVCFCAFVGVCV